MRGKFGHMEEWFYAVNEGVLAVASVLLLVGAAEVGVLLARWPRSRHTGNPDRFLYTLATPLLGLLALMLGFSFGLSLSSHESRIMEVVDEAKCDRKSSFARAHAAGTLRFGGESFVKGVHDASYCP